MTCIFCGTRHTLDAPIFILRGKRSTLDVWYCVFFANRIVRAVSSGDDAQIAWQAWDIVRVSFCVATAVFGADLLCVACHFEQA